MEMNKIFASILMAGVIAMFAGFISKQVVHSERPHEDAYVIEADEGDAAPGPVKAAGPEPILAMLAEADIEKGKKLSSACTACHNFEKGGPNMVGPNLYNVVNGPIAHIPEFAYSDVLKAKHAEGLKWDYDNLNQFLYKPKAFANGTKMGFLGLKKDSDRANIIAWMRSLSDAPAALPSAEDIAATMPSQEAEDSTEAQEGEAAPQEPAQSSEH